MNTGIVSRYIVACQRGAGQVMFQGSALTGALFLAGILAGSLGLGGDGHIAVFAGALTALAAATAYGFMTGKSGCDDGLCGFNAVLTGCAAYTFFTASLPVWIFLCAVFLTMPLKWISDRVFRFTGISSLTFPFIIATWILIYVAEWTGTPAYVPESIAEVPALTIENLAVAWLKGVSEVFLIDSWITGILFLAGLWVASQPAAIWAAVGSAGGMAFAFLAGCPADEIMLGLWGFSPALTAIAVGVTFRPALSGGAMWYAVTLFAVLITGLFQIILSLLLVPAGLPVLTLPFCMATWLVTGVVNDLPRHPRRYKLGRLIERL
ncbi:MAG: urea transporter [Duncaniella sp.]|nr:urea transporter [Duncaniella sp.]